MVGNHSKSLMFELGVVEIDTEVIDGGILGLEGGLKTNLLSGKVLDFLDKSVDSSFLNFVFVFESFNFLGLEVKSDSQVINSSLEIGRFSTLVVKELGGRSELLSEVINDSGESIDLSIESLDLGFLGLELLGKVVVVGHELIIGSLVLGNDISASLDFSVSVSKEFLEIGDITIKLACPSIGLLNPVSESLDFSILLSELNTEGVDIELLSVDPVGLVSTGLGKAGDLLIKDSDHVISVSDLGIFDSDDGSEVQNTFLGVSKSTLKISNGGLIGLDVLNKMAVILTKSFVIVTHVLDLSGKSLKFIGNNGILLKVGEELWLAMTIQGWVDHSSDWGSKQMSELGNVWFGG